MTTSGPPGLSAQARAALAPPLNHRVAFTIQERRVLTIGDLQQSLGVSWANLKYALDTLEAAGIIHKEADASGRITFTIQPGIAIPAEPIPRARRIQIARHILENPGVGLEEIAQGLDIPKNAALHDIHALAEAGLVVSTTSPPRDGLTATTRLEAYVKEVERL